MTSIMNPEEPGHDSVLRSIYIRVKECKAFFLSLKDLKELEIQASQVETSEDRGILFDPCFFEPHPERVLQKYPLDHLGNISDLYCEDLNYSIKKVEQEHPEQKYPITKAKSLYKKYLKAWPDDDWQRHAHQTQYHVECHSTAL